MCIEHIYITQKDIESKVYCFRYTQLLEMTKFFFSQILVFILIISVISRTDAAAAKRCQKEIYSTNCTINKCQSDCLSRYPNLQATGNCNLNSGNNGYACVCTYNCKGKPNLV
ncbi:hypothetical protein V8G54_010108 [Vigna mungo]|uniref:Defensin-like protein n=1 Tax=Vigna mungo TaxID=3915 RepID=A0AAQ3NV62_VIGMU